MIKIAIERVLRQLTIKEPRGKPGEVRTETRRYIPGNYGIGERKDYTICGECSPNDAQCKEAIDRDFAAFVDKLKLHNQKWPVQYMKSLGF